MTIAVVATVRIEGYHQWIDAPPLHAYLALRHRHEFHIRVEAMVGHENREIEVIALKASIRNAIHHLFGSPAEFGNMSCESIGALLLERFGLSRVEVLEDGENGAVVAR